MLRQILDPERIDLVFGPHQIHFKVSIVLSVMLKVLIMIVPAGDLAFFLADYEAEERVLAEAHGVRKNLG